MEVRVLARRGQSVRAIVRETGLSRNTVRRYLRTVRAVIGYGPRAPRPQKLTPFESYLRERIEAARPHWIPATVLLHEIRQLGYDGGISRLRSFTWTLRPASKPDPVVRFETEPGVQMQADFTVIRRGRDPLLAFVATLGYSRASYVRFVTDEDTDTLCQCLSEAFAFFGGVPLDVLLDNPKTVVIERDYYGEGKHRFNAQLLECAERFGFKPRLCRPYRARTKGKVERFNHYLKNSFVVPLAASLKMAGLKLDANTANAAIGPWLTEIANARVHGTTGEVPNQRLAAERLVLLPLPANALIPVAEPLSRGPLPVESLQHPLSVYDQLLEVVA